MKYGLCVLILGGASLVGGCAITSSYAHGPHGRPVHSIDGTSAAATYKKADKLCPMGYDIIAQQGQATAMDYMMTVECKASAPSATN